MFKKAVFEPKFCNEKTPCNLGESGSCSPQAFGSEQQRKILLKGGTGNLIRFGLLIKM